MKSAGERWLAAGIIIILIAGFALTLWTAEQQDQNMRDELLIKTRLAASGVRGSQVAALAGSAADLNSPDYLALKQQMGTLRHADPEISFTYLIGQKPDGTYFFFVDSEPADSSDYSPPGQTYPEVTDLLASVYTTGREITEGPESDRWGTWISGVVPVNDSTDERRIAVFGIDIDASHWNQQILIACLPSITGTLLVVVMLLAFFYIQRQNDRERRRLNASGEALKESGEQFRALYDEAPYAYFSIDTDCVIIRCNNKAAQITGIPVEKIIDTKAISLYADQPEGRGRAMTVFSRYIAGETIHDEELLMQHANGKPRWVSLSLNPVRDTEGKITQGRMVLIDITERKKIEEALRTVNKKLNLLSGITRHDIINQVSAAQMFIGVIEMEGELAPDSKVAKDIKIIDEILTTIDQQIAFTRDYQDLGVTSPEWYRVGAVVEMVASPEFEQLSVENKVKTIEVYADPLFEKVIYNLFDNAVRHGEKTTTIRFYSEKTPEGLKLICEDDGVGVPADAKEKIFRRQYYQNTGLGLFLSQEILSITGMTITETGKPGEGARFEILVPDGAYRM